MRNLRNGVRQLTQPARKSLAQNRTRFSLFDVQEQAFQPDSGPAKVESPTRCARVSRPRTCSDRRSPGARETFGRPIGGVRRPAPSAVKPGNRSVRLCSVTITPVRLESLTYGGRRFSNVALARRGTIRKAKSRRAMMSKSRSAERAEPSRNRHCCTLDSTPMRGQFSPASTRVVSIFPVSETAIEALVGPCHRS
jgi:hypothetical protein